MIEPISAFSIAGSGITVTVSPDYLLDWLTAGYVLLTLALAIIAFISLRQTHSSLDLARKQMELNRQQSEEATAASEKHSQATIDAVNRQIAASEHQAQEALYNQHKPVIVPVSTPASTDADIFVVVLKNKGIGVALNTWGTLTIVGIPIIRYASETHFLVPDNIEQIAFTNGDTLYTQGIFEDYPLFPPDSDNGIRPHARLMLTYNDAFGNKYLIVFDHSTELGWRQIDEIKKVNKRFDELVVGRGWFNQQVQV